MPFSESQLAELRAGSHAAQVALRRHLGPRVTAACAAILGNPALAEETAEDILMDFLVHHVHHVHHPAALEGYVRMMTVRRCRRLRDHGRRHEPLDDRLAGGGDPEGATVAALDHQRERARLAECLARLRPRARRLLQLKYHHAMTQTDIGDAEGVSKQYVGRVIAQGLEALRRCLEALA